MSDSNNSSGGFSIFYFLIALFTARVGYKVNLDVLNSNFPLFWAIADFFFWPFAWIKWFVCEQVNMSVIKSAFSFFFQ